MPSSHIPLLWIFHRIDRYTQLVQNYPD